MNSQATFSPYPLTFLTLSLALVALPAAGTSYVMMSDEDLAAQARIIADVSIVEADPMATTGENLPATDYLVEVNRLIQGHLPGGRVVVRVPGGLTPGGDGLHVYGAPRFAPGERALLFLNPRADGTYAILHLMLGAFHGIRHGDRLLAVRDLSEAHELTRPGGTRRGDAARSFDRFSDWLAARAAGEGRPVDYLVSLPAAAMADVTGSFRVFESRPDQCADGKRLKIRWFRFDDGDSVSWIAHRDGQPGMAGGGLEEFRRSLAAWNDHPDSDVRYTFGGTTVSTSRTSNVDGMILFDDPNDEIAGRFDCSTGGVLAIGGPSFSCATRNHGGEQWRQAIRGRIVTQDGAGCFFGGGGGKNGEAVFGHELGHTLGLDHSCGGAGSPSCADERLADSLMRPVIHTDGRGARLGADDRAAVASLYGDGAPAGPPNEPPPPVTGACGGDPKALCLLDGRFRVTVAWENQHRNGQRGDGFAIPDSRNTGFFWFFDPNNVELVIKMLDGRRINGHFWLFYGALSDVEYTLTVTDTESGQSRSYRNTPGSLCGKADIAAFRTPGSENGVIAMPLDSVSLAAGESFTAPATASAPASGPCGGDALCLLQDRFAVEVAWKNPRTGDTGIGRPRSFTEQTGFFWFFGPNNVELVVKMLDGRNANGRFWVFYGTLTDLEYTLTVTDRASGEVRTYHSPPGSLCGRGDTRAF